MTMRTTRTKIKNSTNTTTMKTSSCVGCGFEDGQGTRNRAASSWTSWRPGVLINRAPLLSQAARPARLETLLLPRGAALSATPQIAPIEQHKATASAHASAQPGRVKGLSCNSQKTRPFYPASTLPCRYLTKALTRSPILRLVAAEHRETHALPRRIAEPQ